MNRNKLARQHGYYDWESLIRAADSAKKLKSELQAERAANAPLRAAVVAVEIERAALDARRAALEEAFLGVAEHYQERAVRAERDAAAARAIGRSYAELAAGGETVKLKESA